MTGPGLTTQIYQAPYALRLPFCRFEGLIYFCLTRRAFAARLIYFCAYAFIYRERTAKYTFMRQVAHDVKAMQLDMLVFEETPKANRICLA